MFSGTQVTYDGDMGYLYLAEDSVVFTDELEVNANINLDFGGHKRLIGIEFFGYEADCIREWSDLSQVFQLAEVNGEQCYSFRVNDDKPQSSYQLNEGVTFYFSQKKHKGFLGIDICNVEAYQAEFLVGEYN
jgi:uncharacterized protein YuzE